MKAAQHVEELIRALREAGVELAPIAEAAWIDEAETRAGMAFPPSFRALVTRYSFPEFVVGEVEFFSNGCGSARTDLARAIFLDAQLSSWLLSHGYLQVGRAASGSYDPVCFTLGVPARSGEPALVQLDHEDILQGRARVSHREVASSFFQLVSGVGA